MFTSRLHLIMCDSNDSRRAFYCRLLCKHPSLQLLAEKSYIFHCVHALYRKHCSAITTCLVMNKKMDAVKEMAEKLHLDVKSLQLSCLPHMLVHILPLSAAAAADQQNKLTAVGFDCYNMLITEVGKQVSVKPLSPFCTIHSFFIFLHWLCLQCFDAVGWAAGRASGL